MKRIVSYIHQFNLQQLPKHERNMSRYILLDTIGQMAVETNQTGAEKVFLQSYQLVKEEMDEGNALAKGHPACHFVPALLHLAKEQQAPFEELLEAFVCGYEVGARTGEIITLKDSIHPHSNWGVIGGVAALSKLYRWNERQIEQAINLAGQTVFPTLWEPILEGYEARNALIGLNNMQLLLFKQMIDMNISSSPKTWSIMFNEVLGNRFNMDEWNTNSDEYYVNATYFKFYNSCRFCHAPLDLVNKLLQTHDDINISTIESIEIETYRHAARLNNQQPNNAFAGKFSIPYAVAEAIAQQQRVDVDVMQLAQKIDVIDSHEMNALLPVRRTKMTIHANGHQYSDFQDGAIGDQATPYLLERVIEKFKRNVQPLIGTTNTEQLMDAILYERSIPYELI